MAPVCCRSEGRIDELARDVSFRIQGNLIRRKVAVHEALQIPELTLIVPSNRNLCRGAVITQVDILPTKFQVVLSFDPIRGLIKLISILGTAEGISP